MKRLLQVLMLALVLALPLEGLARTYKASFDKATPEAVISALKAETGMEFVYQKALLKMAKGNITCNYSGLTLEQLLNRVINIQLGLGYEVVDKTVVVKSPNYNLDYVRGTISGVVYDVEENEPLAGASVIVDGTTLIGVSDVDGRFSIKGVEALNPVVTVVFVGMKTLSEKVTGKNQNSLRFDMTPETTMMSEVIVTGYADVKKEKMTGSAVTLSADKLEDRHAINIIDNLEGRVAGLSTYGGKPVIRGVGTISGSTQPLLVVDGLPIEGTLEDLNPYDIESVNVLKDAAASAIYGARAANGIIVVTTKSAKKKGKIDIDFSTDITLYEKKNMDYADNFYMTPEQQIKAESEYYDWYFFQNDPDYNNDPANNLTSFGRSMQMGTQDITPLSYAYYQVAKGEMTRAELETLKTKLAQNNYARDYADAIYRRQVVQQYNLSLRSASDRSRNSIVMNYKKDNSGIINHYADWLNISFKGSYDLASWLTATLSINSIFANSRTLGDDYNSSAGNPWYYTPYQPFYNEDGTVRKQYAWYSGNAYSTLEPGLKDLGASPVDEMYQNTQSNRRQNMRYHADLLFRIIPGLTANAQFIYETETNIQKHWATEESHAVRTIYNAFAYLDGDGNVKHMTPESGGFLQTNETTGNYWTARGQLNYNRTFGKHDIAAIAGLEFRETTYKGTRALALGYDDQLQTSSTHTVDFGTLSQWRNSPYFGSMAGNPFPCNQFAFRPYMEGGMGIIPEVHHRYGSGYANLTYTYDERYNVFGSFRKDYADVFGLNSKFRGKPLWSVGAGWNVHQESFMREIAPWANFLKLRFSYGVTGNIYQGATSVMTASSGDLNSTTNLPISTVTSPANPDLRWEQNRTTNVGIDFAFLNYRLRGSLDYYNKEGKDIFNGMNLDPTTGFTSIVANVASIVNRGVELAISYDWFRANNRRDFSWTTSATVTYNKNKVTEVENDATVAYQLISSPYKTGYPVNAMWSYRYAQISDIKGMEGQVMMYGNNDAITHSASSASVDVLEFSGQSDPKYIVGMDNNLRWNGFSLNFTLAYYGGHKMRCLEKQETFASYTSPLASYFLNAWTPENKTDIPGLGKYASTSLGSETRYSNRDVHDASFIKLRNVTFGYTVPENFTRRFGINQLTLRFQINNPKALWTANSLGVDPETLGIRRQSSYVFGLNLNL